MTDQGGAKPGWNLSIALPPEVDPDLYRAHNPDLRTLTDEKLIEHYAAYGRNEGRLASPAGSRPGFKALIPPKKKILEIGPAQWPGFTGPNVKYFDVQDSAGLRQRAIDQNEDPKDTPERIHYVSPVGDLSIVQETFDFVYSSHCIEHQPDLIKHLIDVDRILVRDGLYFVICPDRRYCFDRHIPETTLGEMIEAHMVGRQTHRVADVVDGMSKSSHNDPIRHWAGDSPPVPISVPLVKQALDKIEKARGAYIDSHVWRLTPATFRETLETLYELGMTPLRPLRVYDTTRDQNEFFAVLGRGEN